MNDGRWGRRRDAGSRASAAPSKKRDERESRGNRSRLSNHLHPAGRPSSANKKSLRPKSAPIRELRPSFPINSRLAVLLRRAEPDNFCFCFCRAGTNFYHVKYEEESALQTLYRYRIKCTLSHSGRAKPRRMCTLPIIHAQQTFAPACS